MQTQEDNTEDSVLQVVVVKCLKTQAVMEISWLFWNCSFPLPSICSDIIIESKGKPE
jgi:hypothetical protein